MVYRHHVAPDSAGVDCYASFTLIQKTMPRDGEPPHGTALLTNQQVVEQLQMSLSQLARLRAARKIGYIQRGGRIFYTPEEVERVRRACEVPALHPVVTLGNGGSPTLPATTPTDVHA